MTMCDQQPHEVAVANSVYGLHNDFMEGQGGGELLGGHRLRPVYPVTALLVKHVVMHAAILHAADLHQHCNKTTA